jgi:hypothetical protein
MARGGVEPPTFRFSEVGIIVHRIPLTSATCIAAWIRTPMNEGERRRMETKDETTIPLQLADVTLFG